MERRGRILDIWQPWNQDPAENLHPRAIFSYCQMATVNHSCCHWFQSAAWRRGTEQLGSELIEPHKGWDLELINELEEEKDS